jgi:hypothetical protein
VCALVVTQCDYRGDLVDPKDSISPYFTLKGQISEEISRASITSTNSPRIVLIPMNDVYGSEAMRSPGAYQKYYGIHPSIDSFVQSYESIDFEGEFPLKFTTVFNELPQDAMLQTYRSPSGKQYQLGMYAIALFDDINKDSKVVLKADMISKGVFEYADGSDTMIGIVPDNFIVYLEQADFTSELNTYISEQIGENAQWVGLGGGYNLVHFTSTNYNDYKTKYTGIERLPAETEVSISPFKILPDTVHQEIPAAYYASNKLFYFQRRYVEHVSTGPLLTLKINSSSDSIFFVSDFANEQLHVRKGVDRGNNVPEVFRMMIGFSGIVDLGYAHYSVFDSMKTKSSIPYDNFFYINARGRDTTLPISVDTLIIDSDIVHLGYQPDVIKKCGGNPIPIYVDYFSMQVMVSENAPWTIVTKE